MADQEQDQQVGQTEQDQVEQEETQPAPEPPQVTEDSRTLRAELDKARAQASTLTGMLRKAQGEAKQAGLVAERLVGLEKRLDLLTRNAAGEEVDISAETKQLEQDTARTQAGQRAMIGMEKRRQAIGEALGDAGLTWEAPELAEARQAWQQYGATGDMDHADEAVSIAQRVARQVLKAPGRAKTPAQLEALRVDRGGSGGGGTQSFTRKQIEDMPIEEYVAKREAIDKAYLEGRIK